MASGYLNGVDDMKKINMNTSLHHTLPKGRKDEEAEPERGKLQSHTVNTQGVRVPTLPVWFEGSKFLPHAAGHRVSSPTITATQVMMWWCSGHYRALISPPLHLDLNNSRMGEVWLDRGPPR